MPYELQHQLEEQDGGYIVPWRGKLKFRGNYQVIPVDVSGEHLEKAINFAVQMTFGTIGAHKNYRQTSNYHRSLEEILINTLQGKIAEFAAYQAATDMKKTASYPDLSVSGLGVWDTGDLIIDEESVSVKSAKHFSNMLFLEVADWNDEGLYIPDNQATPYDYFLLVRVKLPDRLNELVRTSFPEGVSEKEVYKEVLGLIDDPVLCDIVGQLKHGIFKKYVIGGKQVIHQGDRFQQTRMDVDNYYVCANDLWMFK